MGRFLNADVYASTGQGILSNNMFAYCKNNPAKHVDYNGLDAVVVFDKDTFGHIGIIVQDEEGKWWHFYWGTRGGKGGSSKRVLCFFGITVEQYSWCVEFTGDASSLEEINEAGQYTGQYEEIHYFSGDFSAIIDNLNKPSGKYNLYANNCSQYSLKMLALADTDYADLFSEAAKCVLPSNANKYISNNKGKYGPKNLVNYEYALGEQHIA